MVDTDQRSTMPSTAAAPPTSDDEEHGIPRSFSKRDVARVAAIAFRRPSPINLTTFALVAAIAQTPMVKSMIPTIISTSVKPARLVTRAEWGLRPERLKNTVP
jgi:hypothetical protein